MYKKTQKKTLVMYNYTINTKRSNNAMSQKIRILVIEDEVMTAMRLKQIINSDEYEVVHSSTNADDALEYIKENTIDLILADINLQGEKTGLDVARALQDKYTLAIIFITAQTDSLSLKEASQIDYCSYIVKPFTSDDVLTAIKLAVMKYDLHKAHTNTELGYGYVYHHSNQKFFRNNQEITLTNQEQKLLALLINAKQSVCSIETIEKHLWSEKAINDATRRNLFFKLKQKMQEVEIITYKGIGYKLNIQNST
jgi:DNA-binding response OmpR family regulator